MMSSNRQPADIHGINTQSLVNNGASVYQFEQGIELKNTADSEGLCFGFTASLMRELYRSNFAIVSAYKNPLPKPILVSANNIITEAVELFKAEKEMESIAFPSQECKKVCANVEKIPAVLSNNIKKALLTYKTKSGIDHQLLFFNKGNDKCIIQDPSRFTIDNLDINQGKQVLADIIKRSNPSHVSIALDSHEARRTSKL